MVTESLKYHCNNPAGFCVTKCLLLSRHQDQYRHSNKNIVTELKMLLKLGMYKRNGSGRSQKIFLDFLRFLTIFIFKTVSF